MWKQLENLKNLKNEENQAINDFNKQISKVENEPIPEINNEKV